MVFFTSDLIGNPHLNANGVSELPMLTSDGLFIKEKSQADFLNSLFDLLAKAISVLSKDRGVGFIKSSANIRNGRKILRLVVH